MNCLWLKSCPFYNDKMPMEKGIGSICKKKYCEGNQETCARFFVMNEAGAEHVPNSLYPNMLDIAKRITAGVRKSKTADEV